MTKQEFLAMSLPHDIICQTPVQDGICNNLILPLGGWIKGYLRFYHKGEFCNCDIDEVKPICRPLSDLVKEIEHKGEKFVPYKVLCWELGTYDRGYGSCGQMVDFGDSHKGCYDVIECALPDILKLIEWHFDIANLIGSGEAIDVNTLKVNPYK